MCSGLPGANCACEWCDDWGGQDGDVRCGHCYAAATPASAPGPAPALCSVDQPCFCSKCEAVVVRPGASGTYLSLYWDCLGPRVMNCARYEGHWESVTTSAGRNGRSSLHLCKK